MQFDQRNHQVRTDTTRHLGADEIDDDPNSVVDYFEGARKRSTRFAESTSRLREIRTEIETMSRSVKDRPTGVLSGSDADIAYYYLGLGVGIIALLYSVLGTVFAIHGGGAAFVDTLVQGWAAGPAAALVEMVVHPRTITAVVLQAIIFVVLIGTRHNRRSGQHLAALIASGALTYAGWSTLLLAYGTPTVVALITTIPAALIGGALGWAMVRASSQEQPSRPVMLGVIVAGVVAGALGAASLIHWVGLLLAWSVDQVARRLIVVG